MTKKTFFLMFLLSLIIGTVCFSKEGIQIRKDILIRLPLLSQKNARIITNALSPVVGITEIDACYELKVLIITYDAEKIKDDSVILNIINQQEINTTVEKIYSRDIPIIKKNYKITNLIDRKTH